MAPNIFSEHLFTSFQGFAQIGRFLRFADLAVPLAEQTTYADSTEAGKFGFHRPDSQRFMAGIEGSRTVNANGEVTNALKDRKKAVSDRPPCEAPRPFWLRPTVTYPNSSYLI
jgi:hypothetical protein